jgi:hypothetical protein
MRLKPLLFLAGAAGAVAAVVKSRAGGQQIPAAVQNVAASAPDPVKQAAQTAADAVQTTAETVQRAVQSATPGGDKDDQATKAHVVAEPELGVPPHELPPDVAVPDMSDDDPLVRREEDAAAAAAGSIGGTVDEPGVEDPASRPVVEGSGDEVEEAFEAREDVERGNREIEP